MKKKLFIGFITLAIILLAVNRDFVLNTVNKSAGYLHASYDIYTNHPKFYIYGYVRVYEVQDKYQKLGVEPIFRGCLVGNNRYVREMSYNNKVNNALPKLRIIKRNK